MPSVLLFSGLPLDVREPDLAELLTADPTRLPASSVSVTALHNSTGAFLGTFLVEVGSDADAERVRLQYSGQVIDGLHSLAVHHVLPKTHAHPSVTPTPASKPVSSRIIPKLVPIAQQQLASIQQQQQQQQQRGGRGANAPAAGPSGRGAAASAASGSSGKPAGLQLLSRLSKTGKAGEKERQKAMLDKQRAALKRGAPPGDILLARLAKTPASAGAKAKAAATKTAARATTAAKGKGGAKAAAAVLSPVAKTKAKTKKTGAGKAGGAAKVARAKKDASGGKMDVDKPVVVGGKTAGGGKKTQEQLDEEMRAYERARRFA